MNTMTKDFYNGNRRRLIAQLPNHLLVISAHSLLQYSADTAYPFRQDSNFWYLTGINEPDIVLTIDTEDGESTLYLPDLNEYQKEWDGDLSKTELQKTSGVDEIRFKSDLSRILKNASKKGMKIGYVPPPSERIEPYGFYANPSRRKLEEFICNDASVNIEELVDIRIDIARLRSVKQPEEISAIQAAIDITGLALRDVESQLSTYTQEKQIERDLSIGFLQGNGDGHGFDPIVASGKNAAIIHYRHNNDVISKNELILLDVGAKVQGYSADISRTWSVGSPTKRQRELYEACLSIQVKGFSMLRPGVFMRDYQNELEAFADGVYKKLSCSMAGKPFPHGFSHFLGIDVHDAGDYGAILQENMVITVEPGIYLPDEGIGIRIEDDVIITKNGIKNLSENIPKVL